MSELRPTVESPHGGAAPADGSPAPSGPAPGGPVSNGRTPDEDRPTALRMARIHLRTGSLALARAELETLAGSGALDDEALLDLAEVRWRTDDLTGAGEAAAAYISSGRVAVIALVVAAEATAALGRPSEARRLSSLAVEMANGSLDSIFAGMPRSDVWPAAATEPAVAPAVPVGPPSIPAQATPPAGAWPSATTAPISTGAGAGGEAGSGEPLPDPAADLAAAREALEGGDRAGAAIRLAVVLRLAPALAPAVLDVAAAEPGPEFDLIRGDALRLVGRETQARRSFAAAARPPAPAEEDDPSR